MSCRYCGCSIEARSIEEDDETGELFYLVECDNCDRTLKFEKLNAKGEKDES